MRKILIVSVLLACLIATVAFAGCSSDGKEIKIIEFTSVETVEYTGSFAGNGVGWLDEIAATNDGFVFSHAYNEVYQSEELFTVALGQVTIENDYTANSYLTYYANLDDIKYTDYKVAPIKYNGEVYRLTAVTLDKIPATKGLKVLFVQTIWDGAFTSSEVGTEKAVLVSYIGE